MSEEPDRTAALAKIQADLRFTQLEPTGIIYPTPYLDAKGFPPDLVEACKMAHRLVGGAWAITLMLRGTPSKQPKAGDRVIANQGGPDERVVYVYPSDLLGMTELIARAVERLDENVTQATTNITPALLNEFIAHGQEPYSHDSIEAWCAHHAAYLYAQKIRREISSAVRYAAKMYVAVTNQDEAAPDLIRTLGDEFLVYVESKALFNSDRGEEKLLAALVRESVKTAARRGPTAPPEWSRGMNQEQAAKAFGVHRNNIMETLRTTPGLQWRRRGTHGPIEVDMTTVGQDVKDKLLGKPGRSGGKQALK